MNYINLFESLGKLMHSIKFAVSFIINTGGHNHFQTCDIL